MKSRISIGEYIDKNFGHDYIDKIWSDKNEKSPYDASLRSNRLFLWSCPEHKHEDVYRSADRMFVSGYTCKHCNKSRAYRKTSDFIGKTFGDLEVMSVNDKESMAKHQIMLNCRCSCGADVIAYGQSLKSGGTKTCGNKSIHRVGENNSNWRGGITTDYETARKSKEYSEWRGLVYAKDWYTCQCCGEYGSSIEKNAHHFYNFSDHTDKRFNVTNGITLCKSCHYPTEKGSFHNLYGTQNNTPEQLEEYINNRRKSLGMNIDFSYQDYLSGERLKPNKKKEAY